MEAVKPDIIIPFIYNLENLQSCVMIYVRSQTNRVNYESAIIKGCQEFGDVIYLANINGRIFIDSLLVIEHYATQYRFAMQPLECISEYPEIIDAFESHFGVNYQDAKILSPYDAILELNMTPETLFNIFVDDKDFLRTYGQTFKKIQDIYVVNYDLPEIISQYTPHANIFTIAVLLRDHDAQIHDLNEAIFEELRRGNETILIDGTRFDEKKWYEQVRRTYHISYNHIEAMFDMKDFVFSSDGSEINLHEIPFAHYLINENIISEKELFALKRFSLVYHYNEQGKRELINIQECADTLTLDECVDIFKRIDKSSIRSEL